MTNYQMPKGVEHIPLPYAYSNGWYDELSDAERR